MEHKNIGAYEASLGSGESEAMQKHQVTADLVQQSIIENNCNFKSHMDWKLFESECNEVIEQRKLEIIPPGWSHVEYAYYSKMPGHETGVQQGHIRETWRGTDGVWMPDAPITKVQMTESMIANMKKKLSAPTVGQTHAEQNTAAFGAMVKNAGLGGMGTLGPRSDDGFFVGDGFTNESQNDAITQFSPAKSMEVGAKPAAPSPPAVSVVKETGASGSRAPTGASGPTPTSASARSQATSISLPPPPTGVKRPNHPPAIATSKRLSSNAQGATVADAAASKPRPGRPPVSVEKRYEQLDQQWKEAGQNDVLFFGKDSKAGGKIIKYLEQATHAKISACSVEEIPTWTAMHKRIHSIMQIHLSYLSDGPDSQVFKTAWESMQTWCSLEPQSTFEHPAWLQCVVHRKSISSISDSKAWLQAISLDRLSCTGTSTVEADQASLISEKAVLLLKHVTKERTMSALKDVFNFDMPFDTLFSEPAAEWAQGSK